MLIESYVYKLKLAVDEALTARRRAIICKVTSALNMYNLCSDK